MKYPLKNLRYDYNNFSIPPKKNLLEFYELATRNRTNYPNNNCIFNLF